MCFCSKSLGSLYVSLPNSYKILSATILLSSLSIINFNESIFVFATIWAFNFSNAEKIVLKQFSLSSLKGLKHGIVYKNMDIISKFKDIDIVIFDKTGTITTGNFNVSKIISLDSNYLEEDILEK